MQHEDLLNDTLLATRRALHAMPEVGLVLPATQAYLLERLEAAGIEYRVGDELSSIVAIVRGGAASSDTDAVLVRSDMDALPVAESTGLPFAADNGAMHACGHDLHMAVVLHAALETQRRRAELKGNALFVFQPGEEGHGGAQLMLREGVLHAFGQRPVAALGLHVLAHHLPLGAIVSRPGAVLAGSTLLDITITGRGGHGSAPHLARSPLVAAADLVSSTPALLPSRVSAFEPAVLSFGSLQTGTARNVIPDIAELGGVIRTFDDGTTVTVEQAVRDLAKATALTHDVHVDVRALRDTIPTKTEVSELQRLRQIAPGRVAELDQPLAISEDFSWFLREIPGVFLLIGATTGDPATSPSNHSANATFDESVLAPTARLVVDWVFGRLGIDATTHRSSEPATHTT
ncbi:M20 family metallopeptidase [Citricoccus sp. I39-566]|uniref:M20 metallopeptidase family protein n=1 Tax=Citricoccus sp. I39-566 TaxID=3073268 RepID=UPI00286C5B07|nr:M20 family metallopeptidase [Citricoccus sp. I39-566]WMY78747.1 M20 family metallopeptidase [Citricoccus sp. I39-566]